MYSYITGKVIEIESNYIVIDNNGVGYLIYCANPYSYNVDSKIKIYLYQQVKEDELSLFGFKTVEEKNLFLKLISVKGIGARTALPMLATGTPSGIIDAIERENIIYLKKFPKIGDKIARQIILDLKGKLVSKENQVVQNDELVDTLQALGYKSSVIKKIVAQVDTTKTIEDQVKDSLKLLLK